MIISQLGNISLVTAVGYALAISFVPSSHVFCTFGARSLPGHESFYYCGRSEPVESTHSFRMDGYARCGIACRCALFH
jgi:hypothetical protein